jgi:hypothetical protein
VLFCRRSLIRLALVPAFSLGVTPSDVAVRSLAVGWLPDNTWACSGQSDDCKFAGATSLLIFDRCTGPTPNRAQD